MSLALMEMMAQIKTGLDRCSARTVSRWANRYVKIPDPRTREVAPLSFKYHPWTKEIGDCEDSWVSPKAAQMALTQIALTRAIFLIDVRKTSVAYFLPKQKPDATDFSKDRFDSLIEASPHLASIFTTDNAGHKQAGLAALYIRGMRSMSAAKSIPVGAVIFDEFDEMQESIVAQAEKRVTGQFVKQTIKFSTPTVPNKRIDLAYQSSTQEKYVFKCPRCGRFTSFAFPDGIVLYTDSILDRVGLAKTHYRCDYGCRIDHGDKFNGLFDSAKWESQANHDAEVRGFWINQFYSFTEPPSSIAKDVIQARTDPAKEQELHNSIGGRPVIPKGSALVQTDLDACKGSYLAGEAHPVGRIVTMGFDVGNAIHFAINAWTTPTVPGKDVNTVAEPQLLLASTVEHFEDLDDLMREWQVHYCVGDANPERRKATEFANRFEGYISLCLYIRGLSGRQISTANNDPGEPVISVDRTVWLDTMLAHFRRRQILLPANISDEYCRHLKAVVKRYYSTTPPSTVQRPTDEVPEKIAKYINVGADHFAHAQCYAEIALPMALSMQENRDVSSFL